MSPVRLCGEEWVLPCARTTVLHPEKEVFPRKRLRCRNRQGVRHLRLGKSRKTSQRRWCLSYNQTARLRPKPIMCSVSHK